MKDKKMHYKLPVDLSETNTLDFNTLCKENETSKACCVEIHSPHKDNSLTDIALSISSQAQLEGFEIIWLDVLNGKMTWDLAHNHLELKKAGLRIDQFTNIPIKYLTEEQILIQVSPLLEVKKTLVILDNVNYLNLMLSIIHRSETAAQIEARVNQFLEKLADECVNAAGILVVLRKHS